MATEVCNIMLSGPMLRLSASFVAVNLFNCMLERNLVTPAGPWAQTAKHNGLRYEIRGF